MEQTFPLVVAFGLVCLAAHRVGRWFSRIGLPYITGYLAVGALVGTFGLDLIPTAAADDLRFVDELALAVIAFIAGSELRVGDLRGRVRSIGLLALCLAGVGMVVLGVAIFALTGALSFATGMTVVQRTAVAVLGAAVLLALSPPSTIAVIKDVRARGPFTSTALVTTVVMDVVVIVLFAVAGSVAAAMLRGAGIRLLFLVALVIDLAAGLAGGYLVGRLFGAVLTRPWHRWVKMAMILGVGLGIFRLAGVIETVSGELLPFRIYIEPLLLSLTAGFVVVNATRSRDAFEGLLHDIGPPIYVAFFTLTGLSLKLDTLVAVLPAAIALFVVRAAAIATGSRLGATLAGEPQAVRRHLWLALLTQAGIALGLAREAAVQFPELGESFATLIISVVVLNEIFGPVFLGGVLRRVGEADGGPEEQRALVIFGIEPGAYALADRLAGHGWTVRLTDTDTEQVARARADGRDAVLIDVDDVDGLDGIGSAFTAPADAIVVMDGDDVANLAVCRAAVERFGVPRAVARVNALGLAEQFRELGALVVDHTSAMIGLLEGAVRAPDAAELVLHADPDRETVQITVTEPAAIGQEIRALHLPADVLVVAVNRNGQTITPDGYTRIHRGDDVTLIGTPEALAETTIRMGY